MCSGQKSRVATVSQAGSTRTGCREYMTTRAFRMAKAASGGGAGVGLRETTLWLHNALVTINHAGCMWRNIPSIEYSAAIHFPALFKTSCPNNIAYMVEVRREMDR